MSREQLLELVLRLPRTADGVPVIPGMELHTVDPGGSVSEIMVCRSWEKRQHTNSAGPYPDYTPERACFSTRELAEQAALAARGQEHKP